MRLIAMIIGAAVLASATLVGCGAPGESPTEKRAAINELHDDTLRDLYEISPEARDILQGAPGYAVFTNLSTKIFFAGGGSGYGLAVDNGTDERTYMRMGEVNVGLGLGVQDFRAVFVFLTEAELNGFINSGWEFGGDADAQAQSGEKGGAVGGALQVGDMLVYQITDNGLAAALTVGGTKYWKYDELN